MINIPVRPRWCPPGTMISEKGWVSKTGELLACRKFTKDDIAAWKKTHGLQRKSPGEAVLEKKITQDSAVEKTTETVETVEDPKPAAKRTTKRTAAKRIAKRTTAKRRTTKKASTASE